AALCHVPDAAQHLSELRRHHHGHQGKMFPGPLPHRRRK
ncbi:MAG: hypothetical protein AMXMBFR13_01910, partial [Phycisphaerae bacterium]